METNWGSWKEIWMDSLTGISMANCWGFWKEISMDKGEYSNKDGKMSDE